MFMCLFVFIYFVFKLVLFFIFNFQGEHIWFSRGTHITLQGEHMISRGTTFINIFVLPHPPHGEGSVFSSPHSEVLLSRWATPTHTHTRPHTSTATPTHLHTHTTGFRHPKRWSIGATVNLIENLDLQLECFSVPSPN